jgi:hypothetical protein
MRFTPLEEMGCKQRYLCVFSHQQFFPLAFKQNVPNQFDHPI